jgi:hypothetical protein
MITSKWSQDKFQFVTLNVTFILTAVVAEWLRR